MVTVLLHGELFVLKGHRKSQSCLTILYRSPYIEKLAVLQLGSGELGPVVDLATVLSSGQTGNARQPEARLVETNFNGVSMGISKF